MVVSPVFGHTSAIFLLIIISLTCMKYLSCKFGGKTLYMSSTALIEPINKNKS